MKREVRVDVKRPAEDSVTGFGVWFKGRTDECNGLTPSSVRSGHGVRGHDIIQNLETRRSLKVSDIRYTHLASFPPTVLSTDLPISTLLPRREQSCVVIFLEPRCGYFSPPCTGHSHTRSTSFLLRCVADYAHTVLHIENPLPLCSLSLSTTLSFSVSYQVSLLLRLQELLLLLEQSSSQTIGDLSGCKSPGSTGCCTKTKNTRTRHGAPQNAREREREKRTRDGG